MKKILLAGIGFIALTAPSLVSAQQVTLSTAPTSTAADVTTTVAAGCTISSTLTAITVNIPLNGGAITPTTPSAGSTTVTCNTPAGVVSIGSDPLKNPAVIDANETTTFTNEIDFAGYAVRAGSGGSDWRLASRVNTNGSWQSARLDANEANNRIQQLEVSAVSFGNVGKLPVAGTYTGKICITVDPLGLPTNAEGNKLCSQS